MAVTKIELSSAQGLTGVFTDVGASGNSAVFSAGVTTGANLATVANKYEVEVTAAGITSVTADTATHAWKITGGSATTEIIGSDYNDTLIASVASASLTGGLGKDVFDISAGAATVTMVATDYDYNSDVIKVDALGATSAAIAASLSGAGLLNGNSAGGQESLTLNEIDGYYKAHLTTGAADAYLWHGKDGSASNMDGSNETKTLIMVSGDSSDTLVGGSKADTIFATSAGAYAFGGAGSDIVSLKAAAGDRQFVGLSTDAGKDSIGQFEVGFADTADVVVLRDGSLDDLTISGISGAAAAAVATGADQVIKLDSAQLTLNVNAAMTAPTVVGGAQILVKDVSGDVNKVAAIRADDAYVVANDGDIADYYIGAGKKTAVSFAGISEDVVADLGNTGSFEDKATFKNVVSVVGGTGNSTLVGASDTANYLRASGGKSTLWGGGSSKDTLLGAAAAADTFFVAQYDGNDTIGTAAGVGTFQTGTSAEDGADTLMMLNSPVASLKNDGTNTVFTFADGSTVTLARVSNGAIRFSLDGKNVQTAQVGKSTVSNNWNYASDVNMYFGGSATDDTLTVSDAAYDGASLDIRLNNTLSQTYSSVEKVDASLYSGKAFISGSDEGAELLVGGSGKTTLWGGLGAANDTLKGTTGDVTSFYFGANNGQDVIVKSDSDDKVVFYDFANTDLTAIDTAGSQLSFTFVDGSSLTIENYTSSSVQTFEFTNSTWTYDKATRTFTQTK